MSNLLNLVKHTLALSLVILPFPCWSQSIIGTVEDNQGNSIALANIILFQSSDSTFVAGCTSDDNGKFSIATENMEGKFLRVSYVGYKTASVNEIGDAPLHITLEPMASLDEIEVTAQHKLYEQRNGEIIANVKGTILEKLPKTADIISHLPFVSGQDGEFTVFGKSTPVIYINNRLVQNMSELDRLMPSKIKSIKVNMMPGAKYDASVGAVIQIITEKRQGDGLSASTYASSKYSRRWSMEEYAVLNYRYKAWDLFGSAYWIQNRKQINMKALQQLSVEEATHEVSYQEKESTKSKRIAAVCGVNFSPNENVSTGVQYVFDHSSWKNTMFNGISHTIDNVIENTQQVSLSDRPDNDHNINAYFSGNLRGNLSLNVNLDWTKGTEKDNMYSYFSDDTSDDVNTASNRHYDYYASKGILAYTGRYVNMEAGAEYSYTDMTQTYDIDNATLGIDNSNDVTKQNRWALFFSVKANVRDWGFGAGMRYEGIVFDYFKNDVWNKEQSRKYHKLFPNLFMHYSKGDIQATLNYERKIKYPTYSALRSNIQYSSPYIYESGNPLLQPQMQNDFTCLIGYKDFKAVLGYTIYENYTAQVAELYKDNNIVLMRPENLEDVKNRFFAFSYTPTIGIWNPNVEFGGQWQKLTLSGKTYDKPVFRFRLTNSFSFPHQWFLNASVGWRSKGNADIYLLKSSLQTSLNVTKRMFNERMSVSLMANDFFKTERTRWHINHSHVVFDYDKYNDSRYVQLTVQYNFNATKSKYKGDSSSDEKQRL